MGQFWPPPPAVYESYTPDWTSGVVVGNGQSSGYYWLHEGLLHLRATFVLGSTSEITGNARLRLPVGELRNPSAQTFIGMVDMYSSGVAYALGIVRPQASDTVEVHRLAVSGSNLVRANLSSSAPFTWGTGDRIDVQLTAAVTT